MVSKFAILNNLLLASLALAAPSSRLESRLARRRENRQSQLIDRVESPVGDVSHASFSKNWAGAVWNKGAGTFTSVSATFQVPTLSGSDGSSSGWVGIDGDSCQNAILQTGVDFTLSGGHVSYSAWYEWFPDNAFDFTGITINPGNTINATVVATSMTSGTAIIENLTNGQIVSQVLTSSSALCGQDAEWILEDFKQNGSLVPFANFGTVTFNHAVAPGTDGTTYTPSGAMILDIKQNNQVLTNSSTSGDSLTVKYV